MERTKLRLPLQNTMKNRDEDSEKDSKIVNGYIESTGGKDFTIKRPGLIAEISALGSGQDIFSYGGYTYSFNPITPLVPTTTSNLDLTKRVVVDDWEDPSDNQYRYAQLSPAPHYFTTGDYFTWDRLPFVAGDFTDKTISSISPQLTKISSTTIRYKAYSNLAASFTGDSTFAASNAGPWVDYSVGWLTDTGYSFFFNTNGDKSIVLSADGTAYDKYVTTDNGASFTSSSFVTNSFARSYQDVSNNKVYYVAGYSGTDTKVYSTTDGTTQTLLHTIPHNLKTTITGRFIATYLGGTSWQVSCSATLPFNQNILVHTILGTEAYNFLSGGSFELPYVGAYSVVVNNAYVGPDIDVTQDYEVHWDNFSVPQTDSTYYYQDITDGSTNGFLGTNRAGLGSSYTADSTSIYFYELPTNFKQFVSVKVGSTYYSHSYSDGCYTSTDLLSWTKVDSVDYSQTIGVTYANGYFYRVSYGTAPTIEVSRAVSGHTSWETIYSFNSNDYTQWMSLVSNGTNWFGVGAKTTDYSTIYLFLGERL